MTSNYELNTSITKWLNLPNGKYEIESIHIDNRDFSIILQNQIKEKIKISFFDNVISYKVIEESYAFSRVYDLSCQIGNEALKNSSFFEIHESAEIENIMNQKNIHGSDISLKHILMLTPDYVIDIIFHDFYLNAEELSL